LLAEFGVDTEYAYNFIQFHNTDEEALGEVSLARNQDIFHHPLKLTVSLAKDGTMGALHIDRNPLLYSETQAEKLVTLMLGAYNKVKEVAGY
jgi:hypothetical protein